MSEEKYTYVTMTRSESEPTYKFAEIKYGKIVSINSHWVPLEEYRKFFAADSFFIDITGVTINGEEPTIGDCITFTENGYQIQHIKSVFSLAEAKAAQIERLKLIRNQKELEPIEYNNNSFDADKDSLLRLDKARQSLEDNNLESIEWTTANNQRVEVTVNDFKGINTAVAYRSNQLHIRYNELKNYINSIEDDKYVADIINIEWDFDITKNPDGSDKIQEAAVETENKNEAATE